VRIIDVGQEATGFIAIGQVAVGVFAFGQMASGVVAVGQVATGVFTLGQGAVGLVSIGMGGVGIYWTGAMIGVGGRGFGIIVPLAPSLGPRPKLPSPVDWASAQDGDWVSTRVTDEGPTFLDTPDGVRIRARLRRSLRAEPSGRVLAHVVDGESGLEVDRIVRIPRRRITQPRWWAIWAVQMILYALLCAAWIGGVLVPWATTLWSTL
jgi:hypothetical protein